ncbi:hypothetical protein AAG570_010376 [Ranatra chinensis]|uniref:Uncharacterized protein n=1 Tax=Ranatra chinensis TaxID=642074 RepID=A0ABD0YMC9_9HEMI
MQFKEGIKRCCKFFILNVSNISNNKSEIVSRFIGCFAPVLIPPLHIATLYYFWHQFSRRVDKRYCSCSCWDTVFKGTYESGIASYKHIYFNASSNTFKIWALTVVCVIAFYESMRRLVLLGLEKKLRYNMLVLFLSAIFSHYYSWWAYLNYWNDEYYAQWNHQLFFTITELISTGLVLQLADDRVTMTARKVLIIVGISVIHIIAGSWDQFFINVIQGEGRSDQVVRDISFMIPDLLHGILPLLELRRYTSKTKHYSHQSTLSTEFRREVITIAVVISIGLFICSML